MANIKYLTTEELEAGLDDIYLSPKDDGCINMIVADPRMMKEKYCLKPNLISRKGLWETIGKCAVVEKLPMVLPTLKCSSIS